MLGVNIALDLWWIPRYGIAGAAVATSLAYIAGCLITLGIFQSFSKTSWRNLFIPTWEDFNLLYSRLKR
jgi:Na+-driven multidrug efflux pump